MYKVIRKAGNMILREWHSSEEFQKEYGFDNHFFEIGSTVGGFGFNSSRRKSYILKVFTAEAKRRNLTIENLE